MNIHSEVRRSGVFGCSMFVFAVVMQILCSNTYAQDTLHVTENIYVAPGEVMEIPAGTVVLFHGYHHFDIEGALVASGTESAPVVFTAVDTTQLYNTHLDEGGWNGLRFSLAEKSSDPPSSMLTHCVFQYSKASKVDFHHGGAISVIGLRELIIDNCTFTHNYAYRMGGAVYLDHNHAHIHKSRFVNNVAHNEESEIWPYGGGIATYESRGIISWSVFEHNRASGMGGALNFEKSHPTVYNCIINDNYAPLGGGVGVVRTLSANFISNSLIVNNTAMFFGGGMAFVDASMLIANTNILGNTSAYGGGLYFNEISSPVFYNSIIRGNIMNMEEPNQVWIFDGVSGPEFYHCNVEGGFEDFYGVSGDEFQGAYQDNLDADPGFENEPEMNYSLTDGSPCIDAGLHESDQLGIYPEDLAGNARFSGIRADIGAFEFQDPYTYYSLHIAVEGEGITEPEAGWHYFKENDQVSLHATPLENWKFDHWVTPQGNTTFEEIEMEIHDDMNVTAVFSPVTNMADLAAGNISVFPNPVRNTISLKAPSMYAGEKWKVCILSISGEVVMCEEFVLFEPETQLPVQISQLKAGMYFLVLENSSEIYTHKIVKQ